MARNMTAATTTKPTSSTDAIVKMVVTGAPLSLESSECERRLCARHWGQLLISAEGTESVARRSPNGRPRCSSRSGSPIGVLPDARSRRRCEHRLEKGGVTYGDHADD
jgi:hypothetical protein